MDGHGQGRRRALGRPLRCLHPSFSPLVGTQSDACGPLFVGQVTRNGTGEGQRLGQASFVEPRRFYEAVSVDLAGKFFPLGASCFRAGGRGVTGHAVRASPPKPLCEGGRGREEPAPRTASKGLSAGAATTARRAPTPPEAEPPARDPQRQAPFFARPSSRAKRRART